MNLMFLFVGIQGHAMTLRSADNLNYLIAKAFFGNKCIWNVAERHQRYSSNWDSHNNTNDDNS